MKTRIYLKCLGLIWTVLGLIACQQNQHSFSSDADLASSSLSSTVPASTEGTPSTPQAPQPLPDTRVTCGAFMNMTANIDMNATEDRTITGDGTGQKISEPLRTITVTSGGGNIDIRSAITATLIAASGQIRLNAQNIPSARVGSGSLCIRADHIGSVDASMSSGPQVVIANTVDSLKLGNAVVHIYNATVTTLDGESNGSTGYYHQICLHKGAKILNLDRYNPSVLDYNCDSGSSILF